MLIDAMMMMKLMIMKQESEYPRIDKRVIYSSSAHQTASSVIIPHLQAISNITASILISTHHHSTV